MDIRNLTFRPRKKRSSSVKARANVGPLSTRSTGGPSTGFAKRVPGAAGGRGQTPPGRRRITLAALIVVCVAAGGGVLFSLVKKPAQPPLWQTCLLDEEDGFTGLGESAQPALIVIPPGTYTLPSHASGLYAFLEPYEMAQVTTEKPFLIQNQKMSRLLFEHYAEFVDNMPPGDERDRRQSRLGLLWDQGGQTTPAVQGVSWEAATDFSLWLTEKTGCAYGIPSREEWMAAILHLYKTGEQIPKPGSNFSLTPLGDLLRGGREWTQSPCSDGYYLVGEESWVSGADTHRAICMPPLLSVAGFRLVLDPTELQNNARLPFPFTGQVGGSMEPTPPNRKTNP